jgi:hypothetical protein|tara:strand:- start:44 stop:1261 length:1218 start_codon:yes stop_codon:yes gene_type:complete
MPGETFQTLKSKATQQAKKSGMSQSAAENYGSAMATQSAIQSDEPIGLGADFLGTNKQQQDETLKEIYDNIGSTSESGIKSYSLPTATQNVQQQIAARKAAEISQGQPSGAGLDTLNKYMTKIGTNLQFPSLPFSPLGIITNTIQGLDAKKTLLTNLKNKNITGTDKDTLARLLAMEKMQGTEFITDDDLKDLDDESMGIYENLKKDITDIPMDDIEEFTKRMNDMSLGETVGTMYGDLTGKRDTSGITTLENITDNLGSEGLAYLKLTDPKTYYRLRPAQTSEQMRDLANVAMPTGNSPEDRRFAAQIMEAREMAARSKESQDRASGIMTAPSAPPAPPPVVPPVVPPAEDEAPENPILNPIMSQRDPFNLAKFYASLPQYTQQGVMSPSLMQYYRNLGLFPRV